EAGDIGWLIWRSHLFLGKVMKHGGYPEKKLRIFPKGKARFKNVLVHEDLVMDGVAIDLTRWYQPRGCHLLHHAYPTLSGYVEHMNKYSSLGAEMEIEKGRK